MFCDDIIDLNFSDNPSITKCGEYVPLKVKIACDGVVDLGTIKYLDYKTAQDYIDKKYDNFDRIGGCSAAAKKLSDNTTIVGRNLDLTISNKPAYINRTNVNGFYKTIGLTYTNVTGDDYSEVLKNGVRKEIAQIMPFISSDVMNEYGLYIEENMRTDEYYDDGTSKFACSGINPGKPRMCLIMFPRYMADRCKSIEEVLNRMGEIDWYTVNANDMKWPFCYMLADATGRYGVLEFANNEWLWHENAPIQTNFYLEEKYRNIEDYQAGIGRYELLEKGLDAVYFEEDMFKLMKKVSYTQAYNYKVSNFDVRTEFVEGEWTTDYVLDESNQEEVTQYLEYLTTSFNSKTRQEKQDRNTYWESVFTLVANCKEKTLKIRFFEDDERVVRLKVNK